MPFDGIHLDEATQTLIRAKDILIGHGWCVGYLVDDAGRHCAMGAINAVYGFHHNTGGPAYKPGDLAVQRLENAIPGSRRGAPPAWAVPEFNNRQKSIKPILKWFDRAIAAS